MNDQLDEDASLDGDISAAHGDTTIDKMREIYGDEFAAAFEPLDRLSDAISATGKKAMALVHRLALQDDYKSGVLSKKLASGM